MSLEQLISTRPDLHLLEMTRLLRLASGHVALLRWPAQGELRDRLAAVAIPRLLLVSRASRAPVCVDELEDWVREPLDASELDIRTATLRRRADRRARRPVVDDSGMVRVGDRWVALPPVQLALARLLVERLGEVVSVEQIRTACRDAGGSGHAKAIKAAIGRVRRRLVELDLELVNVRDRGYLLDASAPDPAGGWRAGGPDRSKAVRKSGSEVTAPSEERAAGDTLP